MEFEEIYCQYQKDIYYFILRLSGYEDSLAEELTQETFYQAFLSFERFRGECGVKTWLCQIAKNIYYKYLRQSNRQERLALRLNGVKFEESFIHQVEEKEMYRHIKKVLLDLDERSRSIVEYRLFSELPYKEIAYLMEIREATAKVLFSRAKFKIQNQLKEEYGYEI